ncbi:kinase-like domain-containing protein, partial [Mycena sp. CBHHK59/15]
MRCINQVSHSPLLILSSPVLFQFQPPPPPQTNRSTPHPHGIAMFPQSLLVSTTFLNKISKFNTTFRRLFSAKHNTSLNNSASPHRRVPTLADFDFLRLLGKGGTAKVYLVRCKSTGKLYAMKVAPKEGQNGDIINEQVIMRNIARLPNRPRYLLPLVASWNDSANYYLIMPFCGGSDIVKEMLSCKKFSRDRVRLCVAQIILALESLHSLRTIHRDLKPANLFLDTDGNIILGDYGYSKHFPASLMYGGEEPAYVSFDVDPSATSGSFLKPTRDQVRCIAREQCGTPCFMSPDQLHGNAYTFDTDIWSLGLVMHRMLTGRLPFGEEARTVMALARDYSCDPVVFRDEDGLDDEIRDVILWFLAKNPRHRTTLPEIKGHTFFSCIDWEALARGGVQTPWRPRPPLVPKRGVAYEDGENPLPGFSFVSPEFFRRPSGPIKAWFERIVKSFKIEKMDRSRPPARSPARAPKVPALSPTSKAKSVGLDEKNTSVSSKLASGSELVRGLFKNEKIAVPPPPSGKPALLKSLLRFFARSDTVVASQPSLGISVPAPAMSDQLESIYLGAEDTSVRSGTASLCTNTSSCAVDVKMPDTAPPQSANKNSSVLGSFLSLFTGPPQPRIRRGSLTSRTVVLSRSDRRVRIVGEYRSLGQRFAGWIRARLRVRVKSGGTIVVGSRSAWKTELP